MSCGQDPLSEGFHIIPLNKRNENKVHLLKEPRSGDLCPKCRTACLDYDGLLNLTCPHCGFAVGGCFT